MERSTVEAWVAHYVEAWHSNDPDAIGALFHEDASYRAGPFDEPWEGRQAIVDGWLAHRDEPGAWSFAVLGIHVAGDTAFVEGRADYPAEGRRFANLWVIALGDDGRAATFTEWWMQERRREA